MIRSLSIKFADGQALYWDLDFSTHGTILMGKMISLDELGWIRLGHHQCPDCSLDAVELATCPVAEVMARYGSDLADRDSFEYVDVRVEEDDGREILLSDVSLQTVVGELVRIAFFQSACPIGRRVKPAMARLPAFPKDHEILRSLAVFFALQQRGADGTLDQDQKRFMESLHNVFRYLARRVQDAGTGDAYANGLTIVDSLSLLFSLSAPELLQEAVSECRFW